MSIQILGMIACIIGIGSYLFDSGVRYKLSQFISSLLFAGHYGLLDAHSAAATQLVNAIRGLLSINISNNALLAGLYIAYWGIGGYFYTTLNDILPLIAVTIGSYAIVKLDGLKFRVTMLVPSLIWVLIGTIESSIGGVAMSSIILCINITKIARLMPARE